jgi:hypothetical protein
MISEMKTNPETHAPGRTISAVHKVDGASTPEDAPTCAVSARKTSWVKACIDEVIESFAQVAKCPYR